MSRNEVAVAEPPRLSLFQIDETLAQLTEYRRERMADRESPPDAEELAALDGEIRRYTEEMLPRKVSGYVAFIRHRESIVATILGQKDSKGSRHGGEIERLRGLAKSAEEEIAYVKGLAAEVLERQPKPAKGSQRLTGADGSVLSLRTNGGLRPLNVTNPEFLPDECCRMTGWVNAAWWANLMDEFESFFEHPNDRWFSLTRMPDNEAIRAKLSEPCPTCTGVGALECCQPENGGCPACGGTGKSAIPGAFLGERGAHVEVR